MNILFVLISIVIYREPVQAVSTPAYNVSTSKKSLIELKPTNNTTSHAPSITDSKNETKHLLTRKTMTLNESSLSTSSTP